MSEYLEPEKKPATEKVDIDTSDQKANALENKGPAKTKDTKVLHKDGSFADMPYNNEPGGGSLEGTVGIGT